MKREEREPLDYKFTLLIPTSYRDMIHHEASGEDRSMNNWIIRCIEKELHRLEKI